MNQTAIGASPQVGSIVENNYVRRSSKVFAVYEHELSSISNLNDSHTRWNGAGWACASFAVGIWTNYFFQQTPIPTSEILAKVVAPIMLVLTVVCFIIAFKAKRDLATSVSEIKKESRPG